MLIGLIGTSGSGKSYWSKNFEEIGYKHYCCDALIEEKLKPVLASYGTGLAALAAWMGEPYEERYPKTQAEYLRYETEVLQELSVILEDSSAEDDIIIDTTGSFVYVGEAICKYYKSKLCMVYLEVPPLDRDQIFDTYFDDPKPIIWGESFKQFEGEDSKAALARCYHDLMDYRVKLYQEYADVVVPFSMHRDPNLSADDLLRFIREKNALL